MIDIVMAVHDPRGTYCKYLGTAINSLFATTSAAVTVHILCNDTLVATNRDRLLRIAERYSQVIDFIVVDDVIFKPYEAMTAHFTIATLYRLAIIDLLPKVNKVIYLDADLVVNLDIQKLWDTQMDNFAIAGVSDYVPEWLPEKDVPLPCKMQGIPRKEYFNAGVMVLNLGLIRRDYDMLADCLKYLETHPDSKLSDQDALNVVFKGRIRYIDERFNLTTRVLVPGDTTCAHSILHYSGDTPNLIDPEWWDELFFTNLMATPWGQSCEIANMFHELAKIKAKRLAALQRFAIAYRRAKKIIVWGAGSIFLAKLDSGWLKEIEVDYLVDSNLAGESYRGKRVLPPQVLAEENAADVLVLVMSKNYYDEISFELQSYGMAENVHYFDFRLLLGSREAMALKYY